MCASPSSPTRQLRFPSWETLAIVVLLCGATGQTARAYSLLPLAAESAQTLPSGVAEAVLGVAYFDDLRFPAFTPPGALRSQRLIALPQIAFRIAAGDWAEIQANYETLYLDEETTSGQTNRQFGSGDMRLWAKVSLAREREYLPALGLRFGTKLPNANRPDRLGTDDTDFAADALMSRDFGFVTTHLNLGLLLLGNSGPTIGHSFSAGGQDDLFEYVVAVASPLLGRDDPGAVRLRLVSELAGQTGSHFGNDRTAVRTGLQLQRGTGMIYLGTSAGLLTPSENVGASIGFVYTIEPGTWFADEEN